eukprot:s192_g38.t1
MSSIDVAASSAAADTVMTASHVTDDSDWDVISATQTLQHEEDEANDFLHLKEATQEELSEELRASMASLAETISQLQLSSSAPATDTMEVEHTPRAGLGYTPVEEMETETRAGLGFSPAAQVPPALSESETSPAPAPVGFVRASQPTLTLSPVRFVLDPENNAFSKLAAFPLLPFDPQLPDSAPPEHHRG